MSTSNRSGNFALAALRAVWSRKAAAALTALAVCAAVVVIETFRGHEHAAEAVVQVRGMDEAATPSGEWLPTMLNELDSRSISQQAAGRAGWSGGQEAFERRLELEPSGGGELSVRFSASEPDLAADGANAYATAFVEEVERVGGERIAGGALGAEAELGQAASPPETPASRPLALGLAALAPGLISGVVVALALARRDRSWRGVQDAEFALGAPVLGIIPELEPSSHGEESAVDGKL